MPCHPRTKNNSPRVAVTCLARSAQRMHFSVETTTFLSQTSGVGSRPRSSIPVAKWPTRLPAGSQMNFVPAPEMRGPGWPKSVRLRSKPPKPFYGPSRNCGATTRCPPAPPLVAPDEPCPVCNTPLIEHELLDPPGFSPENGTAVDERDREQEISYATSAQFPSPEGQDQFDWKEDAGVHLRHAYEQNRRLVIVNRGPDNAGFRVCRSCGAAKPETEPWPDRAHGRPFQLSDYVMRRER